MPKFLPFTSEKTLQIAAISETELISEIRNWLGESCPPFPAGIGDDCSVVRIEESDGYLLTTVDGVGWKKHFDESISPEQVGRKLLARNLSDIASMGGTPKRAVVCLWMSPNVSMDWLKRFYQGIADLALKYEVDIVGGDVASAYGETFIADLCLQGNSKSPVLRKQVAVGDTIWVTGTLGGSILGKHWSFEPRIEEGKWLSATGSAKSMMDISDGLAKDLPSLIGGYEVELQDPPASKEARVLSERTEQSVSFHVMNDGEDFELLFVVDSSADIKKIVSDWEEEFDLELTCIGRILNESGTGKFSARNVEGEPIDMGKGYEHF